MFIGEHHSAGGEWIASPEIFFAAAAEVMPHFQGQAEVVLESERIARGGREDLATQQANAVDHMTKKYEDELAAKKS